MKICVFGAASSKIDDSYIKAVEELGELIAERGHTMVFGAGGSGLMGAAARGVTRGGGKMIGVIPTFFNDEDVEVIYAKCHEIIYTETMRERKQIMEDTADAFIVVPGGIGTYEELFEILTLKQLGRHRKPIVIYNINGFYDEMLTAVDTAIKKGFISENCLGLFVCTKDGKKAVDCVEKNEDFDFSVKDLKEC